MPPPRRTAAPRLPDELWCDVAAWLTVPEAVALLEVERATAGLRDRLPWATLVACNTTLWTPHVRRALTAAKAKDGGDDEGGGQSNRQPPPAWTYARTAALFSSLRFHTDHADRFDPVPTCVLPVTADVDVYARAVTTIQDLEEATCTVTPRGLCLWDGDASTLTWHDWARDDAAGTLLDPAHAQTLACPFTADVPWQLPDTIETLTVWAAAPPTPLPAPVRLLSVAGEPEDLVGVTNYRQYFRMVRDTATGTYATRELLLGGGFEAGLARPQCAHYVYPYLVLVGHHVLPPVSSYTASSKVVGVWNIETQTPVLHHALERYGWYRSCACTATNETGRVLYWVDDDRQLHRCALDRPYASTPDFPKRLPADRLTHVTGLAVSEVKRVVALYSQTAWTLYDLDGWQPLRTFALRHTTLHLCPWINAVLLTRVIGTKLLVQRVRLGYESFFLSSPESIAT